MATSTQVERLAKLETALEEHCRVQNGSLNKIWDGLSNIQEHLAELSTKLIQDRATADSDLSQFKREVDAKMIKRPSWAISLVVTILSTIVGIQTTVIVALLNKLF